MRVILFMVLLICIISCKKPVEETIIGTWDLQQGASINDTKITFKENGEIKKSNPNNGSAGNWYLVNGEVFFDTEYTFYLNDGPWSGDVTCNVTYQIVDCKRNKLWIKDISSSLCGEVNYYDNELGNTWEYKRVK